MPTVLTEAGTPACPGLLSRGPNGGQALLDLTGKVRPNMGQRRKFSAFVKILPVQLNQFTFV
jgi:hypothetical protein